MIYILALLFSMSSFAYNCTAFWANGFPDADVRREEVQCDEFLPVTPINPRIKIYFTNGAAVTEEMKTSMRVMASALSYAYAKYDGLGNMPYVKAILYHRSHYSDANALAYSFVNFYSEPEACPILFYPLSLALSKPHFEQLAAHELFHCFQKKNFKEQVNVVTNQYEGMWWFEGMAQVFSNFVYPAHDFEYHSYFAPLTPETPLFEQESPYRLAHFFQSYFNNTGMSERRLVEVMRAFPTSALGDEAQLAARIPQIADKFHKYAEELTAGTLRDSSGAIAPLRANPTVIELSNAVRQEVRLSYTDFTVQPTRITFPAGYRYRLTLNLPGPTKVTMKKAEETHFLPFMDMVVSSCDEDRKFDIVMTSVNPLIAMNTATVIVEREQLEECACDVNKPPKDECLVGTWELDLTTMEAFLRRTIGSIPGTEVRGAAGSYRATFLESGEAYFKPEELTTLVHMQRAEDVTIIKNIINGSAQSQYSTGEGMICSRPIANNLSQRMIVTSDGRTHEQMITPPFEMGTYHFTYGCEGDTLIYKEALGVGPSGSNMTFDYVFRRIN